MIGILIAIAGFLVYYVNNLTNKLTSKYFELKDFLNEQEKELDKIKSWVQDELSKFKDKLIEEKKKEEKSIDEIISWKLKGIQDKISSLEKEYKELKSKVLVLEPLPSKIDEILEKLKELDPETLRNQVKDSLKEEVLKELQEEIEKFEQTLEERKEQELKEFLDLLTMTIDLPPERIKDGLLQAKRALLSLRDLSKVYVLTGKGVEEFEKLKETLIELLKDLRKLAVISVPEDEVYSSLTSVIVGIKRLKLPMNEDGKELSPEKSFIRIHRAIYELTGKLDEIAEKIESPIPVTPIEKEFYEKLRLQFEELKRLEKQVQELITTLGNIEVEEEKEEDKLKDIEKILKDLGV
ncbi:hypothetical protein [Pyrococcus sp. ST04]|uniref:coiled-coil domain-containing protein n=1 Tax=Pyrococcus sp. ST04 TaxID=1183377 RepID=UPI001ED94E8B|nr:hypothetical protein [Pyrococcus sp. ST04]